MTQTRNLGGLCVKPRRAHFHSALTSKANISEHAALTLCCTSNPLKTMTLPFAGMTACPARTRLIPAFPNTDSLMRLVSAICAEMSDEWESSNYKYMSTVSKL